LLQFNDATAAQTKQKMNESYAPKEVNLDEMVEITLNSFDGGQEEGLSDYHQALQTCNKT
jgi:hypothetical protein